MESDIDIKVWDWRKYVLHHGPESSTRKLVLLVLSTFMNNTGGSCFPSIKKLSECTSLSRTTVIKHLKKADEEGWLKRSIKGVSGQGWKRNEYTARIPEKVVEEINDLKKGGSPDEEGGSAKKKGSSHEVGKAVKELNTNSSSNTSNNNSSKNIFNPAREECEKIFDAYPRKVKKGKAITEIKAALEKLNGYELEDEIIDEPVKWLLGRVKKFASSPSGKGDHYTPHPDNFFRDERYLDDSEEWFKYGEAKKDRRHKERSGDDGLSGKPRDDLSDFG